MTEAADELDSIRRLKARYCRFPDTKEADFEAREMQGAGQYRQMKISGDGG